MTALKSGLAIPICCNQILSVMDNRIEQRKYFRLNYKAEKVMPLLWAQNKEFRVSEISEKGLRVIVDDAYRFKLGDLVQAEILINSVNSKIPLQGKVLRISGNEVIFLLSEGISFKHMISEQRYMRKHYPFIFPKSVQMAEN